ncbi:cell growth-regulating nucleolar protein [Sarcoptes scabiei]|nr:cell growth-regulating nucleolar protein [Sarcoptes scabiei]
MNHRKLLISLWIAFVAFKTIEALADFDIFERFSSFFTDQIDDANQSLSDRSNHHISSFRRIDFFSPYQVLPGSYSSNDNQYFVGHGPFNLVTIFSSYLTTGSYFYSNPSCQSVYQTKSPVITDADVKQAFNYAGSILASKFPEYSNNARYNGTLQKEIEGHLMELASEYFAKFKCFSKYQLATILPTIAISNNYHYLNRKGDGVCSPFYSQNYECLPHQRSKYRTIDGTCNNLRHPYWGRSFTCHVRILPPDYSDGIQAFRMSKAGRPLPNPRTLSNYIAESKDMKAFYTGLILGWGQFINHDITNTEGHLATPFPNTRVDCCVQHSDKCAAIPLDNANDYLLNTHKTRCFNFIRSSPCPLCKFGPREQMNTQTSFLDGSQIYGNTAEESVKLRSFQKALMNPHWNDDQLFQEARRITIAELQHITYNEYLPIILGPLLMHYYNLSPLINGFTQYESFTDPSTLNEFITAASRYGHSQIRDFYRLMTNYQNFSMIALRDHFLEPDFAYDAKNFVMRPKDRPHGIDLVTTNIQRGRDHGIPGYVYYLKACFNYMATTWKDLEQFIPMEILMKLKTIYNSVEDIDLYIGGVSERHFIDASIGPTFGCLVGIQYYHLKFGDRYYYEHGDQSGSFTIAQLNNIRQSTSLARLICRNSRHLMNLQPRPFYLPSPRNPLTDCRSLPELNYLLWKQ